MTRAGAGLVILLVAIAVLAPWLAPNPPDQRFPNLLYAPPSKIYAYERGFRAPYLYEMRPVSLLERTFRESRVRPVRLRWFTGGRLVTAEPRTARRCCCSERTRSGAMCSRVSSIGSRVSLALAAAAALAALLIGTAIGAIAGFVGGRVDDLLSRVSEFVWSCPAIYVALALRAVMPLVLPSSAVFLLLMTIFALFGWPVVARGVRAVIASEREREYTIAARAAGAGSMRIIRQLLPAARGYISVQGALLVPSFILTEATMSFVGLGFPDTTPTWGTLLQQAANVSLIADSPWMLAPAVAIFAAGTGRESPCPRERPRPCTIGGMSTQAQRPAGEGRDGKPFAGIFTPIVTPFTADDRVDEGALRGNVAHWMATPLTDSSCSAPIGEAAQLDEAEADRVVDIVREGVPADRPLIAGTGRESTRATIDATRRAAAAGVDAVLVRTPSFFKAQMTSDVFVEHYTRVADASPYP
jgi:peptide/nickel transport system permease protein